MTESCLGFLQLLFCGTVRQKGNKAASKDSEGDKVKIRVGFEGKDTVFSTENLNVKNTFGQYAVLLDYASNKLVPLHSNGSVMEPLEARKRYVVVLNTHGSSSHKWEDLRRGGSPKKHHRKHGSGKHSGKKKRSSTGSKPSSPPKASNKHEKSAEEAVKEPLLVQKEEDEEDESEEEQKEQEQPTTNFATISFGVSSSMDSMISHSREVYVY